MITARFALPNPFGLGGAFWLWSAWLGWIFRALLPIYAQSTTVSDIRISADTNATEMQTATQLMACTGLLYKMKSKRKVQKLTSHRGRLVKAGSKQGQS